MRADRFQELVVGFSEEFGPRVNGKPVGPGGWLTRILGIGPLCVAIGYQDGYWARRFLTRCDARSAEGAMEWGRQYRQAWLRANANTVDSELVTAYWNRVEMRLENKHATDEGFGEEDELWHSVMASYDWSTVLHWGPGTPVLSERLERLQLLFMTTRVIEMERGPHAAFAYMVGSDPFIGAAPALGIRFGGRRAAPELVASVYHHVVEMGGSLGAEPREPE